MAAPTSATATRSDEMAEDPGRLSAPVETVRLRIGGMTCATCAGRIEKVLRRQGGVASAQVNLASEVATVAIAPGAISVAELVGAVERAGFEAERAASAKAEREAVERADAARA